jgi:hypothetical protein
VSRIVEVHRQSRRLARSWEVAVRRWMARSALIAGRAYAVGALGWVFVHDGCRWHAVQTQGVA